MRQNMNFENIINTITNGEQNSGSVRYEVNQNGASEPQTPTERLGDDGLLHCTVCGKALETIISVEALHINRKVRSKCDCTMAAIRAEQERLKREEIDRTRKRCFPEPDMLNWTFENDDRKNAHLSDSMIEYTEHFADYVKQHKGLLLFGDVGTGKSYYAASIANRLIDNGYRAFMTSFSRIADKLEGEFGGRQEYIYSLNNFDLLVLDDLGVERSSQSGYMQEIIYDIIDSRVLSGLPMVITTNLSAEEIKKPQDMRYKRIYDRILGCCHPVEVSGVSRRRQALKESYADVKAKLGL